MLLSTEGFDLQVAISKNIGELVEIARITTEPWFLLEKLQERLSETVEMADANRELGLELLSGPTQTLASSGGRLSEIILRIEAEIGTTIRANKHQLMAVKKILDCPVSFVWGPPGTGKTSTLGLSVASLVHEGETVLILSHSNTAVDTAMQSMARYLHKTSYYKEGLIVRFGIGSEETYGLYPMVDIRGIAKKQNATLVAKIDALGKERTRIIKRLRDSDLSEKQKQVLQNRVAVIKTELQPLKQLIRDKLSELVSHAVVVGCTFSKASIAEEIFGRQFDAVIIDEASMAYIPHCIYAATLARKRIAVFGDHRQLGPICQSDTDAANQWLKRDIFDESGVTKTANGIGGENGMILLKTQYRMHPSISSIPNTIFYDNVLEDGELLTDKCATIVQGEPNPGHPLVYYDLGERFASCFREEESHSRFNPISALIAVDIAMRAQRSGIEGIGIITPYKAQSRLIHRVIQDCRLDGILSSTVHRFQGSERSLIVFDTVESHPQTKIGKLLAGGMKSTAARLANVAVSRAQGKFVFLANNTYIRNQIDHFSVFRKFNDRLYNNSERVDISHALLGETWSFELPGLTYFPSRTSARDQINKDLAGARHTVAIDWPSSFGTQEFFSPFCIRQGTNILYRGWGKFRDSIKLQNVRYWQTDSFSDDALIGLDQEILWICFSPKGKSTPCLRIHLPKAVALLHSFLQLAPTDHGPIEGDIHVFGTCGICRNPLWYQPSLHCNGQPRVACVKHPQEGRKMTKGDATKLAQLTKTICEVCNSALIGKQNGANGKIFLGCSQKGCKGSLDIGQLV
ncbi:MAG: hypothetical protein DCF23_05940 [Cyanobium sp.]|nr:MAG: hypothetical protein DCF23_05940 [Cyanobium sp.]